MKICGPLSQPRWRRAVVLITGVVLFATTVRAQLAITEMMSAALKTNGMILSTNNSDFWELTNFGTNIVDLTFYKFSDNKETLHPLVASGMPALLIRAGESVVFVRNNITQNEAQFR